MRAFLFPGQASQYVGMAQDLYQQFGVARRYLDDANEVLGLDLKETCFSGPPEKLTRTDYTQPAVFVHSVIVDTLLKEIGFRPDIVAGHSLGEYSALVSAGVLGFIDALKLVGLRAKLMQQCCDRYPGAMAAIVGMSFEQVSKAVNELDGVVVANYNGPDQVVVSGYKEAVQAACQLLKQKGAKRAIPLPVAGAYHSPLMEDAKIEMAQALDQVEFQKPSCPVVANVTGRPSTDPATIKTLLKQQIVSTVLWQPAMETLCAMGVREFYEIGPGKVLQGLLKRSLPEGEFEVNGVDKVSDIEVVTGVKV